MQRKKKAAWMKRKYWRMNNQDRSYSINSILVCAINEIFTNNKSPVNTPLSHNLLFQKRKNYFILFKDAGAPVSLQYSLYVSNSK